jgi:hypothetical protein
MKSSIEQNEDGTKTRIKWNKRKAFSPIGGDFSLARTDDAKIREIRTIHK